MASEFRLPSIGDAHTEAEIREWLVEVGDEVELDQPLVEVETAKSVVQIPSPFVGTVLARFGDPDDVIEVGHLLVVIGKAGETWTSADEHAGQPTARPTALPAVRTLARDSGIDLEDVRGTGPDGRITREDLERLIQPSLVAQSAGGERRRLSMLRRTLVGNLVGSWTTVPHSCLFDSADAVSLLAVRIELEARLGEPVPLEALAVKLLTSVLPEFPEFNAYIDGDFAVYRDEYDIAIAVDAPAGLTAPVVRAAETKSVAELGREIVALASRARASESKPQDLTGATFTVSNLGAVGGRHVTSILPQGTSALLSLGRATDSVVANYGEIAIRPMIPLSLTIDHRLVDGGPAARFLRRVCELIESCDSLFSGADAR